MEINKIYNESCLDTMSKMKDNFIDLTVTSPPYDNLRTYNNNIDKTWGEHIWKNIIKELYRVTKDGGVVVWVVGDATINGSETGTSFRQALYAMECGFNLHDTMIYQKTLIMPRDTRIPRYWQAFEYMFIFSKNKPKHFSFIRDICKNGGTKSNSYSRDINGNIRADRKIKNQNHIIKENKPKSNIWAYRPSVNKIHPATFPEQLANDHIISWSNEGDLVYDPFMGSGTTAKMALINKRNFIGSEISEEYVDLANKRLKPYLMQQSLF